MRFTIAQFTCNGITVPQSVVDIPLTVITDPVTNGTPDSFVIIQGYALFRISGWDSNDVFGYAVSGLLQNLDDVTAGLRARLVPWN